MGADIQLSNDSIRIEYTEANTYLRHYSLLRFIMISVYFAIMAGALTVSLGKGDNNLAASTLAAYSIRLIGLIVTIAFFLYERRLEDLIRYYQKACRTLEGKLGYSLMIHRPTSHFSFIATWVLYVTFFVFWGMLLFC